MTGAHQKWNVIPPGGEPLAALVFFGTHRSRLRRRNPTAPALFAGGGFSVTETNGGHRKKKDGTAEVCPVDGPGFAAEHTAIFKQAEKNLPAGAGLRNRPRMTCRKNRVVLSWGTAVAGGERENDLPRAAKPFSPNIPQRWSGDIRDAGNLPLQSGPDLPFDGDEPDGGWRKFYSVMTHG